MYEKFIHAGIPPSQIDILQEGYWYEYGPYDISPVPLYHDVPNYGLRVRNKRGERALYAVDTNRLDHVVARDYDLYLIEGNYGEAEMEERIRIKRALGEYAYEISAMERHLSIEAANRWLKNNAGPNSKWQLLHGHVEEGLPF